MQRQRGFFDVSNDAFTRKHLICSWVCIILASCVFFGSMVALLINLNTHNSARMNFRFYIGTLAILYLLNIIICVVIVSTKSAVLSIEEQRTPMQSSILTRRIVSDIEIRHQRLLEADGRSHQVNLNNGKTKTSPPPYEYLLDINAEDAQVTSNEKPNHEPVSENEKELLNNSLPSINNSKTLNNEQLRETLVANCNCSKTHVAKPGTSRISPQNKTIPVSSGSGIYTELPDEVLERFSDLNSFIKALAEFQSQNRIKQNERKRNNIMEEDRKKQLANRKLLHEKAFANLVAQGLEDQASNKQTNSKGTQSKTLTLPLQYVQMNSARKILQKKLKSKSEMSLRQGNYTDSLTFHPNHVMPSQVKDFNSEDNSRFKKKGSQSDFRPHISDSRDGNTFTEDRAESEKDISSLRIFQPCRTFSKEKSTQEDQRLTTLSEGIKVKKGIGSSVEDLCFLNPPTCQQNLSSTSQQFYQQDLELQSPQNLQDMEPGNRLNNSEKHYSLNRSEHITGNSKYDKSASWTYLEGGQASSCLNVKVRPECTMHTENSYPLLDTTDKMFSKGSVEYDMNPKDWLASWNNSLDKITNKDASTLFGSRL